MEEPLKDPQEAGDSGEKIGGPNDLEAQGLAAADGHGGG